jgi:hypothetical protein
MADVSATGATAEVSGGGASADTVADVLGALCGEFDEHPATALITHPTAITTRTNG